MSFLTLLGLGTPEPDPLIGWMERSWRLEQAQVGATPGWTGRFGEWDLRVYSPGATTPRRVIARQLRLGFGPVPSAPEIQFFRYDPATLIGVSFGDPGWRKALDDGPRSVILGGGLALDWDIRPDHPALDRLGEFAVLVEKFTAAVDGVVIGDGGLVLELAADRCTTRTLDHDAALAADVLRLARTLIPS